MGPPPTGRTDAPKPNVGPIGGVSAAPDSSGAVAAFDPLAALMAPPPRSVSGTANGSQAMDPLAALMAPPPRSVSGPPPSTTGSNFYGGQVPPGMFNPSNGGPTLSVWTPTAATPSVSSNLQKLEGEEGNVLPQEYQMISPFSDQQSALNTANFEKVPFN